MRFIILSLAFIFPDVLQAVEDKGSKLVFAVHQNNPEELRSIIESEKLDMKQYSYLVHSALDKPEVLEVLLEKGAEPDVKDSVGSTPLYRIIDHTSEINLASVDVLLKHGADPNVRGGHNQYGRTPFFLAAYYIGVSDSVRKSFMSMLKHGGDVTDTQSLNGNTVLHLIASASVSQNRKPDRGLVDTIIKTIEMGADVNTPNAAGNTPAEFLRSGILRDLFLFYEIQGGNSRLIFAVHENNPEELRSIIESEKIDVSQYSFLVHSALDKPEVLEVLLENGAEPDIRDGSGDTPLYVIVDPPLVSLEKYLVSLDILLKHGADPNVDGGSNRYAETPFLLAAFYIGVSDAIRESFMSMLKHGGDVTDTRSLNGNTVLHLVSKLSDWSGSPRSSREKIKIVQMVDAILDRGADINALNRKGNTPLDLASIDMTRDVLRVKGGRQTVVAQAGFIPRMSSVVQSIRHRISCYGLRNL